MHLADNGVPRDATKLLGDLAGRLAIVPHFFQQFDAFIRPRHQLTQVVFQR
jgi:hypothetical protein